MSNSNRAMKKLYLVRHAKSSWDDPSLTDFSRPLNRRGEKDALFMGRRLAKQGVKPDRILASPALRAHKTAEIIAQEIGYLRYEIRYLEELYLASASTLLDTIRSLNDALTRAILVGHNPGLAELTNHFAPEPIEKMPTCSVAELHFDTDKWRLVDTVSLVYFALDYPKKSRQ